MSKPANPLSLAPSGDPYVRRVRTEISDLDRALVDLVNKRLRLVAQLKRYKDEHGIGFVDLAREEWMLQYLQRANRGPLSRGGAVDALPRAAGADEGGGARADGGGGSGGELNRLRVSDTASLFGV